MRINRRYAVAALTGVVLTATSTTGIWAQSKPKIALVQINQQALFFNQMNEGAKKAADAAGAKLVIFNANNDPAAQNNAIETYVQQKVDGHRRGRIDVNGVMPAVKRRPQGRHSGGCRRRDPAGGSAKGADRRGQREGRRRHGQVFLKYVTTNMGGKAKIGIVGALNSIHPEYPPKGLREDRQQASGITMAGVADGRNIQDNALAAAENLITANPDLTAIYATGEPALLGAVAAVESQGKQDKSRWSAGISRPRR